MRKIPTKEKRKDKKEKRSNVVNVKEIHRKDPITLASKDDFMCIIPRKSPLGDIFFVKKVKRVIRRSRQKITNTYYIPLSPRLSCSFLPLVAEEDRDKYLNDLRNIYSKDIDGLILKYTQ